MKYILLASIIAFSATTNAEDSSLESLSDCQYSQKMLTEVSPYIDKATTLLTQNSDYRQVAQWRVSTFNPAFSDIKEKYNLPPSAYTTDQNRKISGVVYTEFVGRLSLFVQEIYNHARNGGDKSKIKEQWGFMKEAATTYAKTCESNS
ncbi:hypothetical protein CGI80_00485 [Vibrio parahaemolyticus]|uniref:hypothetical protein n=1 Tax=Vibrionaceae TaxID=641 RepID=UPI00111D3622|nr:MULTISPECIES: hypothetical protein [Vibrionaceae]QSV13271.1 hypothetical protein FH974_11015 [Photobacterium ganghwense]TOH54197.1 hypothetical protein CGI80_00485 [Vibrio parahaemolyticus]